MDQKKYLKKKPKRFVDKFLKYVRIFQSYDASNNDSDVPQRLTEVTSWLFDAILEGRTCSAINGVLEKHIQEIDKESLGNLRLMMDHLQVKTAQLEERNHVLENELDYAQSKISTYEDALAKKERVADATQSNSI